MEVNQLLNAIVELSQSVARIPCAPEDKSEVLENVKTLFSCYNSIANLCANHHSSAGQGESSQKKTSYSLEGASGGSELLEMQRRMLVMDEKLTNLDKAQLNTGKSLTELKSVFDTNSSSTDQIKAMQSLISERISVIENKSNDLEDLKSQVAQVNRVLENRPSVDLEGAEYHYQGEMLKLHQEIANLEDLVHKTQVSGTKDFAAFTAKARLTNHKYQAGEIIKFKTVTCNVKNCYNGEDSIFRNKSVGVYVFASSINTNSDGDFEAAIVHNGEEVVYFGTPGQKDVQSGTSIVLLLQPGDTVCVQVAMQNGLHGGSGVEIGSGFSNFIGYKIL